MDNLWDILKSQPMTNRLYELSRLNEEQEKTKLKALQDQEDNEIGAKTQEPAFAVTLTRELKPTEDVRETEKPVMNPSFRIPRHTDTTV